MIKLRLFLAGLLMFVMTVMAAPSASAAPYCGITWGSGAKTQTFSGSAEDFIYGVRAGRNDCYDRLVVDISNASNFKGFHVSYGPVYQDGSGRQVPVRGEDIQIILDSANHTTGYQVTYQPANSNEAVNVTNYSTFRQVAWAGSFEGQSTIGLGVRAKLPMRAFVLTGPNKSAKLVVDVAHKW